VYAKPSSRPPPADARRAVVGAVIQPSRLLVLVLTLALAAGLSVPAPIQYLPFAASLVLFGLPHGALDHLVPSRLAGRSPDARSVLGVVLLYAVLAGPYAALWFTAPLAAFAAFVCVTAYHWGAGDLHALISFGPAALARTGPATRALLLAGRGCIPMLVPLVFFPDAYRMVAADTIRLFGSDPTVLRVFFEPDTRSALLVGVGTLVALSLLLVWRDLDGEWRSLLPVLGETALLFAFFAVVPPILAVGVYFTLWHAPRHVARLILIDTAPSSAARGGYGPRALARFGRDAAPLTALALVLLAGLYVAAPAGSPDAGSLLGVYLVLISALTLPHAVVVSYMDLRQGFWGR
jgi:beta-carotene 15,15'-dioxygenase